MTYSFLQTYWWIIVSLLGALLVFLMFVQGANSLIFELGRTPQTRRLVVNSTGRKWEFTFTTLVTFGGAFFASFPLFYSTSFGGAYWLWMIILFSFVLQAVSYEFQNKVDPSAPGPLGVVGKVFGPRTFQTFLVINGLVGPLLLGGAVATFFEGSNFVVEKGNFFDAGVISHWANASHGLDALLNPWVLVFGLAVMFLARTLGALYIINNVDSAEVAQRARGRLLCSALPFVVLFVVYLVHLLLKSGYGYGADGTITEVPGKYLENLTSHWAIPLLMVIGVVMVLVGIGIEAWRHLKHDDKLCLNGLGGIWFAGVGTVMTVLALLLIAGLNATAFYPSNVDAQMSLTIENASSSEFTLRTMAWVSLLIPFVLAYIVYCWRKIDVRKINLDEIENDEAY